MIKTLNVALQKGTQTFRFELLHRPLDLGLPTPIEYYWMDSRKFRRRGVGPNFRSCVDSWWADVELAGHTEHRANQLNLVLAECFPLVNTARSLQDIYLDAHLHETADREVPADSDDGRRGPSRRTYSLPKEETQRLHELAQQRDEAQVRAELEGLFLGTLPTLEQMPAFQKALEVWAGNGVVALKNGGRDALRSYIQNELRPWLARYRRRGQDDRTRMFINMFSYECKVSFYLCYANAWIGLIHSLVEHQGLDPPSARFLRIWHYQNQPIEDPADPAGGQRDAFCGQVLALHPLSGIVLSEPEHRLAIGNWIGHPAFDALHQENRIATCPAYWNMVASILIAAHEYRHSRDRWNATRGAREKHGQEKNPEPIRDDASASFAMLFEEYIQAREIVCSECSGPLLYQHHEPAAAGDSTVPVVFRCRDGGHQTTISIREADLRAHVAGQ